MKWIAPRFETGKKNSADDDLKRFVLRRCPWDMLFDDDGIDA